MLKFSTILLLNFCFFIASTGQNTTPARPLSDQKLTRDFICQEVVYPEAEFENKTEGTVKLSFRIDEKGKVDDVEVVNSVSPAIDAEAVRVFRMILWEPAYRLGQPVASIQEFEFKFDVKKYKKHCRKRGYEEYELPYSPIDTTLTVYTLKDVDLAPKPVFQEKDMNIERFMQNNLQYPAQAYRQSIGGTVRLNFIVEPHGRISNITIDKSIGGGCNEEAIRLLKMLNWMPAIDEDTAVRCKMHMDITFNLPTESDHKVIDYNRSNSL
jgi:protein TonB